VALILTLLQTKHIRMNTINETTKKTLQTIGNTVNSSTHITRTPTQLSSTHTLQNPHINTPTHYERSENNHSTRYTPNEIVKIQIKYLQFKVTLICMVRLFPRTSP